MKKYSIIIPTYNEKDNIELSVREISENIKDLDYEIIFVDDGNDGTDKVIEKLSKKDKHIILKHRTDKKGLSSAVIDGIDIASSDIITVMDADLQHPTYLLKDM